MFRWNAFGHYCPVGSFLDMEMPVMFLCHPLIVAIEFCDVLMISRLLVAMRTY